MYVESLRGLAGVNISWSLPETVQSPDTSEEELSLMVLVVFVRFRLLVASWYEITTVAGGVLRKLLLAGAIEVMAGATESTRMSTHTEVLLFPAAS